MRRLSLLIAIACLASSSLTVSSAFGFHGHHGWGYGCGGGYGGYYGGYRGYYGGGYGGFYGGPAFYGPGYSGATVYSQPYRYPAYYGQPYYSQPFVGQPYASTPVYGGYGTAQGAYGAAQGTYGSVTGAAALSPPASPSGQVRPAGYEAPATVTVAVTIQDDSFQPASLNVQPGTTVRWTNTGSQIHTVSSQDNRWSSRDIAPGETYTATVQYPGTYSYHCRHHKGMQGTIVVASASAPAATQPASLGLEARSPGAAPARSY